MNTTETITNILPRLNAFGLLERITFTVVAALDISVATAELVVTERGDFPAPAGEPVEVEQMAPGPNGEELVRIKRCPPYTDAELQAICKSVASRRGAFDQVRFELLRKITPVYVAPRAPGG
ncbi:hypothetical protein [Duganella sp. Root336D2]|uniref:hypothetical protein n=1 Tax=Duganella sp. Root336D2 TaxID=1736518 RepID=UPI000702373B|nr:hypothetical protein [Duganella sp. Root336D2]KQV51367.1 hypothetical protein ASD07_10760 [Duganella sp. Root336D2]